MTTETDGTDFTDHTFTDNRGRLWAVVVDANAMKRVRQLTGVDLYKAVEQRQPLVDLLNDAITFVDVLFVILRPEADRLKVTDEDFGRAMAGDPIERSVTAFMAGLLAFFPSARRQALRKLLAVGRAIQAAAEAKAGAELDRMAADPAAALRTPSDSPTGSPASAG